MNLRTDEIAKKGIFMSFQSPEEIPGISVTMNFLKYAKIQSDRANQLKYLNLKILVKKYSEELNMNPEYD